MRSTSAGGALRVVSVITLVLLAGVVASGLYLVFFFKGSSPWPAGGPEPTGYRVAQAVRVGHRMGSWLLVPATLALASLAVVRRRDVRGPRVAAALLAVPAVLAAGVTGVMLPFSQMALWAVSTDFDPEGYRWLWRGDEVRFVVVDGRVVGVDRMAWVLGGHAALGVVAVLAVLVVLVRRRSQEPERGGEALVVVSTPTR